ncbi:MAG TPA: alpha/beta hydrolase [Actinomycetota bacterium]|nr:alpha/beta hydrolase [Actinomycetota bacterium]
MLFDMYLSNPDVQGYALEEIAVPTLIISAKDDGLSAFENAARAATRIAGSKLVACERGGHLLLGDEGLVRAEIGSIVAASR